MYAVAYRFPLLVQSPETDAQFVTVWSELTDYFKVQCGALGSRLHLGEDGAFYAYAQWPNEAVFNAVSEHAPLSDFMKLRMAWADLCGPSEIIFQGPVLRDLFTS